MSIRNRNIFSVISLFAWAAAGYAQPVTKVVVDKARLLNAPATVTLVGTLNPVRQSHVGAEIAGIVANMPVRQGDRVRAGDVLCKLNADVLELRLAEATAKLGALKATHAELLAGTRKEDLRRLEALRDEADADFERWQAEMERVQSLYKNSRSNTKEMYDTKADYLRAQRRKIAAQAAYDLGLAGPRTERIKRAEFDVAAQQSAVNRLKSDLDKTVIRAPFAGFVAERTVEVGEWLPAGGEALQLVDLSTMLARVQVPETALPHLHTGDEARISIDAIGIAVAGTVKHIIRLADASARTFPVDIEVSNEKETLAAGMFVRATIPAGESREVVAVPKDAIVQRDGIPHVAITMPGERGGTSGILMPVSTGVDVEDWVTITSDNVRPGMTIITRGNERMQPFPKPITIVDEHGSPAAPVTGSESDGEPPKQNANGGRTEQREGDG